MCLKIEARYYSLYLRLFCGLFLLLFFLAIILSLVFWGKYLILLLSPMWLFFLIRELQRIRIYITKIDNNDDLTIIEYKKWNTLVKIEIKTSDISIEKQMSLRIPILLIRNKSKKMLVQMQSSVFMPSDWDSDYLEKFFDQIIQFDYIKTNYSIRFKRFMMK